MCDAPHVVTKALSSQGCEPLSWEVDACSHGPRSCQSPRFSPSVSDHAAKAIVSRWSDSVEVHRTESCRAPCFVDRLVKIEPMMALRCRHRLDVNFAKLLLTPLLRHGCDGETVRLPVQLILVNVVGLRTIRDTGTPTRPPTSCPQAAPALGACLQPPCTHGTPCLNDARLMHKNETVCSMHGLQPISTHMPT